MKKSKIRGDTDTYFSEDEDSIASRLYEDDLKKNRSVTFEPMKEFQGVKYLPPTFRHKYELSLWRADTFGIVKVMCKYFTPSDQDPLKSESSQSDESEGESER